MLKDEERMSEIQELVVKMRTGYQIESIVADLGKKGKFNRFSEASKRTVRELGNVALYELGAISMTVQCQACLKIRTRGITLLPMWCMLYALAGTEKKD